MLVSLCPKNGEQGEKHIFSGMRVLFENFDLFAEMAGVFFSHLELGVVKFQLEQIDTVIAAVKDKINLCSRRRCIAFFGPGIFVRDNAVDTQRLFDLKNVFKTDVLECIARPVFKRRRGGDLLPAICSFSVVQKTKIEQRKLVHQAIEAIFGDLCERVDPLDKSALQEFFQYQG